MRTVLVYSGRLNRAWVVWCEGISQNGPLAAAKEETSPVRIMSDCTRRYSLFRSVRENLGNGGQDHHVSSHMVGGNARLCDFDAGQGCRGRGTRTRRQPDHQPRGGAG